MIDCGMCGHTFTRQEGAACQSGCPMATGCGMVTCPSCGYEFPAESKVVSFITRLVRRTSRAVTPHAERPAGARAAVHGDATLGAPASAGGGRG